MGRLAQTLAITVTARHKSPHHRNACLRKYLFASVCEMPEQPGQLASVFVHEGVSGSEISCWLALRASVLRRAVSLSGTAQERRAEVGGGVPADNPISGPSFLVLGIAPKAQCSAAVRLLHRLLRNPCSACRPASASNTDYASAASIPRKASCAVHSWQVHWLQSASACKPQAVLANHSVNRTHCGRPSFGL